jgi:hypothetical protein
MYLCRRVAQKAAFAKIGLIFGRLKAGKAGINMHYTQYMLKSKQNQ